MSVKRKHIPRRCAWCQEWTAERVLCRVFPSQGAMEESPWFAGEDMLEGEPNGATRGVWPGKTNAGRTTENWCMPSNTPELFRILGAMESSRRTRRGDGRS